jgi:hypothetical protein
VLYSADLTYWQRRDDEWAFRKAVLEALSLDEARLMFSMTHTHSAPSLSTDDAAKAGGHLIEPYRAKLREAAIATAKAALSHRRAAVLDWRYGTCDLACDRDLPVGGERGFACGFYPAGAPDRTLLVGRVCDAERPERVIATIVNYACHPTTLAWENSLISPDFVGAMRDPVEWHTAAPCLFLQGASGQLAPAEQYVGDTKVADRHGRRLGFAVLSALEAMESPGAILAYKGIVESGAVLGIWRQEQAPQTSHLVSARLSSVELALRDIPKLGEIETRLSQCEDRVLQERLSRQRAVRRIVGDDSSWRMPLWAWRIGEALLVGQPDEAYSHLQTELRRRFAPRPVVVMNLINGACGYLPPSDLYDKPQLYQVWQTPFERGSLERLIEAAGGALAEIG